MQPKKTYIIVIDLRSGNRSKVYIVNIIFIFLLLRRNYKHLKNNMLVDS
jgi:hypothetical protein